MRRSPKTLRHAIATAKCPLVFVDSGKITIAMWGPNHVQACAVIVNTFQISVVCLFVRLFVCSFSGVTDIPSSTIIIYVIEPLLPNETLTKQETRTRVLLECAHPTSVPRVRTPHAVAMCLKPSDS